MSCLVATAASLPQFGPGIRSGPLTPAYGDLVQTPRGLVPLSLEGFSEDVDRDGFVDPIVQTDLPAPAPVALPVNPAGFAPNFGTPVTAAFPVSAFPGVPVGAQQVAADNAAIANTGFTSNLAQGFAAQQFPTTGFPSQQIALANPDFNNPGFATNFAAQQVAPTAFASQQVASTAFASPQVAPTGFASQQVVPAGFAAHQGFQTNFAAPVTTVFPAQPTANNFAAAAAGPCVNNFGAAVPCAL